MGGGYFEWGTGERGAVRVRGGSPLGARCSGGGGRCWRGVELPEALAPYVRALEQNAAVQKLWAVARRAPKIAVYDDYLRSLGGDPDAVLRD